VKRRLLALAFALVLGVSWIACAAPPADDLGIRDGALAPCPSSPNCVSTAARDSRHGTEPLVLAMPAARAWPLVEEVVAALPGTRIVASTPDYIHAESTTRLMGYVDDLELLLQADEGRVAVRSASRTGWSDMGANRARVDELRRGLVAKGVVE